MKRLLLLLFVGLSLSASAQWQGITGTPQINTSNGAIRWNFGAHGVSSMISSVDTSRTSGGATFNPITGVLSIPRSIGSNTLYSGNGTMTGDRSVTLGTHTLIFQGINGTTVTTLNMQVGAVTMAARNSSTLLGGDISATLSQAQISFDKTGQAGSLTISQANGFNLLDQWKNTGIINSADYSANERLNTNALASIGAAKQIADSVKSTNAYTASNGILKTGNNFTLGGSLTQTSFVDLGNFSFTFQNLSPNSNGYTAGMSTSAVVNNEFAQMTLTKSFGGVGAYVKAYPTFAGLAWYSNSTTQSSFNISATGAVYTDQINLKPIEYAIDYSANYDSRSLIDKGYADAHYSTVGGSTAWSAITGKPTTLSGYGITDAYPLSGNPSGFLTGITSGQVTGALGFTPYNATNPAGYITSSALTPYAPKASPTFTGTVTLPYSSGTLKLNTTGTGALISTDGAGTINLQALNGTGNVVMDGSPTLSTPTLISPTVTGGHFYLSGATSGTITMQTQAVSGTYNWNYPITAGTSGYVLTSAGGGTTAMTWTNLANYAFGSPTATTQTALDNSTKLATTAYADAAVNATATYFASGLFGGSGTSGSPYTLGTGIVGISNLSATGTPSSTTYLRGDNTWATISGGTYTAGTGIGISSNVVSIDQTFAPTWTGVHTFSVTNAASSGNNYGFKITNTNNGSGTQAFTDLLVNRTDNTHGSSNQYLMDLQLAGSSVFNVTTGGFISTPSGIALGGISNIGSFSTSGTFSQDALFIINNAAATSGNPSLNSNRFRYAASVWNTTATAKANYANFITEMRTTSGAVPTFKLVWASNLSTTTTPGTFTDAMSLDNSGNLFVQKSLKITAITFANVPASPTEGMMVPITDSSTATYGATITGGGSNHVIGYYNGTNWTVH